MPVKGKYIMKSLLGFRHSDTVEKRRGWGRKERENGVYSEDIYRGRGRDGLETFTPKTRPRR